MLEVGAESVIATVLAGATLHVGQKGGTDLTDKSLGCVDQGKTLLNVFVAQPVSESKNKAYYDDGEIGLLKKKTPGIIITIIIDPYNIVPI